MIRTEELIAFRRVLKELREQGFALPSIPARRKQQGSQADLPFKPAEFFQDDPHLLAAESALRRIRCAPQLSPALAWVKATNPQEARDLNGWLDRLHSYVERRIPLAEFQQQLDQWVQAHEVVVEAYEAAVMAPARPTSGGLRSSMDAHAQLRLWPMDDFDPPVAGRQCRSEE